MEHPPGPHPRRKHPPHPDAARDFEAFFQGITYILTGVIAVRWFTRRSLGHELTIFLLALLEVAAASVATISLSFLACLTAFTLSTVTGLMLFSLRRELAAVTGPAAAAPTLGGKNRAVPPAAPDRLDPRFFAFALACTAAIFILGFLLFFMIPRVGRSLFTWSKGIHSMVSGFSDTVEMGSVGRIKLSRSLVMRVKVDESAGGGAIYLRGAALNYYDGRNWKDTLGLPGNAYHNIEFDGNVSLGRVNKLPDALRQEIILEPTESTIIFGAPFVKALNLSFRFRAVVLTNNDYCRFPLNVPLYDRVSYTAWSEPGIGNDQECEAARTDSGAKPPGPAEDLFLQLPAGLGPVRELARQVAGSETSPCRQARRLVQYLNDNYTYDLDTPPTGPRTRSTISCSYPEGDIASTSPPLSPSCSGAWASRPGWPRGTSPPTSTHRGLLPRPGKRRPHLGRDAPALRRVDDP